jgi:hypothetical protein
MDGRRVRPFGGLSHALKEPLSKPPLIRQPPAGAQLASSGMGVCVKAIAERQVRQTASKRSMDPSANGAERGQSCHATLVPEVCQ